MNPFSFPAIGVDISDESFKFVRFEEGEIKDISTVASVLKDALAEYRRKFPYLVLSLPEEKGFLRLIKIQKIPESEIRRALEFQIEEHIPFPPSELIFDYQLLPRSFATKGDTSLVVTAYPRVLVESYVDAVKRAGFIPVILELESQAVARAVVPRGSMEALLVGDIGRTRTTFSIVYHGQVLFTSTIKMGGRDIDDILMKTLHVSEIEARDVKIGRGIDTSSEEIIKSLSPTLDAFKEEAGRQIVFWNHRREAGVPAIGRIYLCGGDAHLKGLPEYITQELHISCERARIWENLFDLNAYVPSMTAHEMLRYATAIGLALHGDEELFH